MEPSDVYNRNLAPSIGKDPILKKGSVIKSQKLNPLASHQGSVEKLLLTPNSGDIMQGTKLPINVKNTGRNIGPVAGNGRARYAS
jgi:hypothetical protein